MIFWKSWNILSSWHSRISSLQEWATLVEGRSRPSVVPRSIYANQRQQVWWIHPTRQNIKNDACLETNQRASVHVWKKIEHVRPPQTTQCIPYERLLHTLNSVDVCAIERQPHTTGVFKFQAQKGNMKSLKRIRAPKLTRQPFHKPKNCQSPSICLVKDTLLSIITPKSLIESTRTRMIPHNMYKN
jgi:hypothetical protein